MVRPLPTGEETLRGADLELAGRLTGFWRWAFGDLRQNDIRGVFAEWLVAQILEIPLTGTRASWDGWDLEKCGVRLEVKCSAYVQAWHGDQQKSSRVGWSGLTGQLWDPKTNLYAPERTHNADLYVFCVQIEKDPQQWDALDLGQWRFYVLKREELAALGCRSLSLSQMPKGAGPLTASELRQRAAVLMQAVSDEHP